MSTWVQKVQENVRKVISRKRNFERVKFGITFEEVCNNGNIPNSLIMCFLKLIEDGPYKREIFRAPGSCGNVRSLLHLLHNGKPVDWVQTSTHAVASVIKIFLQKLPEGLFGSENEATLISLAEGLDKDPEACIRQIGSVISTLTPLRQNFLALFLGTLKWISIVRGHIHYWQNVKQAHQRRSSPIPPPENAESSARLGDVTQATELIGSPSVPRKSFSPTELNSSSSTADTPNTTNDLEADLAKCIKLCANSLGLSVAPSLMGRSLVARKRGPALADLEKFKSTSDVLTFMIQVFGNGALFPSSCYKYLADHINSPLSSVEAHSNRDNQRASSTLSYSNLNTYHSLHFGPVPKTADLSPISLEEDWSFTYDIKPPQPPATGSGLVIPPTFTVPNQPGTLTNRRSMMAAAMSNLTSSATKSMGKDGGSISSPSQLPFKPFGRNQSSCSDDNLEATDPNIDIEGEYFYDLEFEEPTSSCYFDYHPGAVVSFSPETKEKSILTQLLTSNKPKPVNAASTLTRSLQDITSIKPPTSQIKLPPTVANQSSTSPRGCQANGITHVISTLPRKLKQYPACDTFKLVKVRCQSQGLTPITHNGRDTKTKATRNVLVDPLATMAPSIGPFNNNRLVSLVATNQTIENSITNNKTTTITVMSNPLLSNHLPVRGAERRVLNMRARSDWFLGRTTINPKVECFPVPGPILKMAHLSIGRCRERAVPSTSHTSKNHHHLSPARSISPSTSFPPSTTSSLSPSSTPSSSSYCALSRSPSPAAPLFPPGGRSCHKRAVPSRDLSPNVPPTDQLPKKMSIEPSLHHSSGGDVDCRGEEKIGTNQIIPRVIVKKPSLTRRLHPYHPTLFGKTTSAAVVVAQQSLSCAYKSSLSEEGTSPIPTQLDESALSPQRSCPLRTGSAPDRPYPSTSGLGVGVGRRRYRLRRCHSDTNGGKRPSSTRDHLNRVAPSVGDSLPPKRCMSSSSEGYGTGGNVLATCSLHQRTSTPSSFVTNDTSVRVTDPQNDSSTGPEKDGSSHLDSSVHCGNRKGPQRQDTIIKRKPSKKRAEERDRREQHKQVVETQKGLRQEANPISKPHNTGLSEENY